MGLQRARFSLNGSYQEAVWPTTDDPMPGLRMIPLYRISFISEILHLTPLTIWLMNSGWQPLKR